MTTTETRARAQSIASSLPLQGVLAGLAATEALDIVSTLLYKNESRGLLFKENLVRGNLHAYERAVGKMAANHGVRLSHREKQVWGLRFHKAFGITGGLVYALLRRKFPRIGAAAGLGLGAFFFLVGDEIAMPLLGYTPGPSKFSWKVHARGAISHIAYGVAAESALRLIESFGRRIEVRERALASDI